MTEYRSRELAALLSRKVRELAATPQAEAELVGRLAVAAGITPSTARQILRNEIDMPPLRRLRGFASVLGIPLATLSAAAGYRFRAL